jgi:DNA polymerase (family 10)
MTNQEIAKLLRNVAAAYAIKDEKKHYFQIVAYQKAADAIENTPTQIKDLYKEGKLIELPGIGPSIQEHLSELIKTGKVLHFENLLKDVPQAVFPLLDVPTFGPKKAYKLVTFFKLKDPKTVIDAVAKLAEQGKIAQLEGFGEKSQSDIFRAIQEYKLGKTKSGRMTLPYANELAKTIIAYLQTSKYVNQAYPLGSLRRRRDTIGDIDIAVASNNPKKVIEHFVAYPYKERVSEEGEHTASIIVSSGKQIDLMVQPPESFGSLLQHFTGSKSHNIHLREYALKKGLSLSEYGIKHKVNGKEILKTYKSEEDFYAALGLDWIPPEMREDTGEIELAIQHKLPKLVALSDIKGDFHLHSNYPIEPSHDLGRNSMQEMIKFARQLGYTYMGFSEHNPRISNHTAQQIYSIIKKRNDDIDQLQKVNKDIRIFKLLETDILPDGKLAIDDNCLSILDASIVSIHSVFTMPKEKMTKRVINGLSHPKAKILAHPTGRMINERAGFELNWQEVFSFCKKHHKALEINAWPTRLDLPDTLVRQAVEAEVNMIINTDSHATDQMNLMQYGVDVARRGWAPPRLIVNTWTVGKLSEWFNKI